MGTEVRKQGIAATETEIDGLYVGGNINKEVSVPFCKKCDCRLGEKDLRKTQKELDQERKDRAEAMKVLENTGTGAFSLGMYILFIPFLVYILYLNTQGDYLWGDGEGGASILLDWGCTIFGLLCCFMGLASNKIFK